MGAKAGLLKEGWKYRLRTETRLATGVGRCGSELAAGQGSGKNVGVEASGPVLPSLFCVASGESPHIPVLLLSPVNRRATVVSDGVFQQMWAFLHCEGAVPGGYGDGGC